MYEQINKDIAEAKGQVRKKERLEALLQRAKESLYQEEERLSSLKKVLRKEEKDVKKLEGMSIRKLVYTILGNKEEKLSKEQREFLSAKLKYDECRNAVQVLRDEIESYLSQLSELGDLHYYLEQLLKKKEELVLSSGDKDASKIQENLDKIAQFFIEQNEIREAILAGNNAMDALEAAIEALDEAESMGTWDMLSRELRDVNIEVDLSINISSFDKFADYFFDGFIADWNVQNKIRQSQDGVNNVLYNVRELVDGLNRRYDDLQFDINQLRAKNREIIEGAEGQVAHEIKEIKYIE